MESVRVLTDRALLASLTEPVPVSALSGNDPSRGDDVQQACDLIIELCQRGPKHSRGASALRAINRLEAENSGLRIMLWNVLRKAGVGQEMAIRIIQEATARKAPCPLPDNERTP